MNKFALTMLTAAVFARETIGVNAEETRPFSYKLAVTPEIKKAFVGSDSIEVREITGTTSSFEVNGTYRIVGICHQQTTKAAMLYIGNTAGVGGDAIVATSGSSLYKACLAKQTEFDVTFQLLCPGAVHATIYDMEVKGGDNVLEGIYLGNVAAQH